MWPWGTVLGGAASSHSSHTSQALHVEARGASRAKAGRPSALPAARSPPERSALGPEPPAAGPAGADSVPEGLRPPSGSVPAVGKKISIFKQNDGDIQKQ